MKYFTEEFVGVSYAALMEEVRARVETTFEMINLVHPTEDADAYRRNIFYFEGAYLNLRKVCELLSLSLLLAQNLGASPSSRTLKEWRSDRLLDLIEDINPESFPRPVEFSRYDRPERIAWLRDIPPVFSSEELRNLYFKCNDLMHVGHLKNILRNHVRELDQEFVQSWCVKIVQGLTKHVVRLPDNEKSLFTEIGRAGDPRVRCAFVTPQYDHQP